jgi:hypothetical protein
MMNINSRALSVAILVGGATVLGCGIVGSMVGWHYGAMLGSVYGSVAEIVVGLTAGALGGTISAMASVLAIDTFIRLLEKYR